MNEVLLFLVGVAVVVFAWLGLVVLPGRAGQLDGLHTFAARHGARVTGDGRRTPFCAVGALDGRAFTVTWQPGAPDQLLVAVDCEAPDQEVEGRVVEDAALAARWVAPPAEHLTPDGLDRLLRALTTMAHDIESSTGPGPAEPVE